MRKRTFKLCFWMKGKTNIFILINCVKLFSRALWAFLKSKLSASNNLNICIHDDLLQVFMQANLAFQMLWNAATIGGGNVKTRNMCRGRRNIQMWQGQNFQEKKHSKWIHETNSVAPWTETKLEVDGISKCGKDRISGENDFTRQIHRRTMSRDQIRGHWNIQIWQFPISGI